MPGLLKMYEVESGTLLLDTVLVVGVRSATCDEHLSSLYSL